MKHSAMRLLLALLIAPLAAQAAPKLSDMMAPGLWEMTVAMQIAGMPMSMPAQTIRRCITQVSLDQNNGIPKPQTQGNVTCKTTSMERSGNTLNWTMACTGQGNMQMDGRVTFDSPEVYQSTVQMTGTMHGQPVQMTQRMQGKRISDCQN